MESKIKELTMSIRHHQVNLNTGVLIALDLIDKEASKDEYLIKKFLGQLNHGKNFLMKKKSEGFDVDDILKAFDL